MIERRLSNAHKAALLALHEQAQELQRQVTETQSAIDELVKEWAERYGLPEGRYMAEARPDGGVYLVPRRVPTEQADGSDDD